MRTEKEQDKLVQFIKDHPGIKACDLPRNLVRHLLAAERQGRVRCAYDPDDYPVWYFNPDGDDANDEYFGESAEKRWKEGY